MSFEQAARAIGSVTDGNKSMVLDTTISRQFSLFPQLPREIRLLIWELTIPGPKIVEIRQCRLKKTCEEWEKENNTEWRPGFGLTEEDDIGQRAKEVIAKEGYLPTEDDNMMNRVSTITACHVDYRWSNILMGVESQSLPPEILYVSHEAYAIASSRYTKSFSCLSSVAQTWFNLESDILYMRPTYFERGGFNLLAISSHLFRTHPMLDFENVRRVKHLAIGLDDFFGDVDMLGEGDFELMLCFFMCIFRGVEKIYCILEHLDDIIRETEEPLPPESMIDPVDLYNVIKEYSNMEAKEATEQEDVPEGPMVELPTINPKFMDDWWKALRPGGEERPKPVIEFRCMLDPEVRRMHENLKDGLHGKFDIGD